MQTFLGSAATLECLQMTLFTSGASIEMFNFLDCKNGSAPEHPEHLRAYIGDVFVCESYADFRPEHWASNSIIVMHVMTRHGSGLHRSVRSFSVSSRETSDAFALPRKRSMTSDFSR